jgi:hypothetical protein
MQIHENIRNYGNSKRFKEVDIYRRNLWKMIDI